MKIIEEIKSSTETQGSSMLSMDTSREPTREEIMSAFESLASWAFDKSGRDFERIDHWEEHCMRFLLENYLDQAAR
jgi:hypothetical protein